MRITSKGFASTIAVMSLFPSSAWAIEKPKPQEISGKIKWIYDYEDGKRISRETGRPMFVVFRCER